MKSLKRGYITWALAGPFVVGFFFFGTLFVLNRWDRTSRDALRANHAQLLRDALERYHATRGVYPIFTDNPVIDLRVALVEGRYLKNIPQDPLWPDKPYRYTTAGHDGQSYGLLFHIEGDSGPTCRTGVKVDPGWWGKQQDCPF
jgi:hypothetical protein